MNASACVSLCLVTCYVGICVQMGMYMRGGQRLFLVTLHLTLELVDSVKQVSQFAARILNPPPKHRNYRQATCRAFTWVLGNPQLLKLQAAAPNGG